MAFEPVDKTEEDRKFSLTLVPKDAYGNFLGPDYACRIQVKALDQGFSSAPIEDHGDGRYSVTLTIPIGTDPKVSIEILGKKLFTGGISELEEIASKSTSLNRHIVAALILLVLVIFWLLRSRK